MTRVTDPAPRISEDVLAEARGPLNDLLVGVRRWFETSDMDDDFEEVVAGLVDAWREFRDHESTVRAALSPDVVLRLIAAARSAPAAGLREALASLDRILTDSESRRLAARGYALLATPQPEAGLDEVRLTAWAECVQRLIAVAPTRAVIEETGITASGHATPPERKALREQAHAVVASWLARDLAALREPKP